LCRYLVIVFLSPFETLSISGAFKTVTAHRGNDSLSTPFCKGFISFHNSGDGGCPSKTSRGVFVCTLGVFGAMPGVHIMLRKKENEQNIIF